MKRVDRSIRTSLAPFVQARSGATSIEYAFIAMLISLAIIGGVTSIGPSLAKIFTNVRSGFGEAQAKSLEVARMTCASPALPWCGPAKSAERSTRP